MGKSRRTKALVHSGDMRTEVLRDRNKRPNIGIDIEPVRSQNLQLIFDAAGEPANTAVRLQFSSVQADDGLNQGVDLHALLNEVFADIEEAAQVLTVERLYEDLCPDRAPDTAELGKPSRIVGVGFLAPDGEELGGTTNLRDIDREALGLEFTHHVGADSRFDGNPLHRFDTKRTKDILYLASMRFPFSFEQDFTELVDKADCCFRYTGIQTNPVLPTCQHDSPSRHSVLARRHLIFRQEPCKLPTSANQYEGSNGKWIRPM